MPDSSPATTQLHHFLDRWHASDLAARDDLLRGVCGHLERLARTMLRGFPNVRRHADTGDVLQEALVRLTRTLETLRPASSADFLRLSAVHVRRALLDLARFHGRRERGGLAVATGGQDLDAVAASDSSSDLDRWSAFHEAVERLPEDERAVVELVFYQGCTHAQAGEILGISERTVCRRWQSALWTLSGVLRESGDGPVTR